MLEKEFVSRLAMTGKATVLRVLVENGVKRKKHIVISHLPFKRLNAKQPSEKWNIWRFPDFEKFSISLQFYFILLQRGL